MAEVLADRERQFALWAPVLRGEEVDWGEIVAGYVAQVDFPGAAFWREISRASPDALVVLSTRPAEAWYHSAASTIFQLDSEHGSSPFRDVWRERFGFEDRETMVAADVRAAISGGKNLSGVGIRLQLGRTTCGFRSVQPISRQARSS